MFYKRSNIKNLGLTSIMENETDESETFIYTIYNAI